MIKILFFLCHEDPTAAADGCIAKLYVAPVPRTAKEDDVSSLPYSLKCFLFEILFHGLCICQVRQVFEKYGNVTEIILPRDKMSSERAGDLRMFFLLIILSS